MNAVVSEATTVDDAEVMRVLAPGGVALVKNGSQWQKRVKDWPKDMDEWPQYLRAGDNNAVSQDRVGPPDRLKWTGGTPWARSHMSAVTVISMVSASGRLYTIEDLETVEYHLLPGKYFLIARDAFNGVALWKKPLGGNWTSQDYNKYIATQYQRRIAAIGDILYCPLGMGEPVSAIDGATGEVIKEFPATAGVQEFVYDRGVLYAAVGQAFGMKDSKGDRVRLMAFEVESGETLWEKQIDMDGGYMGGTLAVKGEVLAYCTKTRVQCANAATGNVTWHTDHAGLIPEERKNWTGWLGSSLNNLQPTLVLSDELLYCSTLLEVSAYRLSDGQRIWFADNVPNYNKPSDIFLAADLVWTGLMTGHDPQTGKVVRTLKQEMQGPMSHDRCYRNRISETYFINSKTGGTDFLRLDGKREFPSPWVRATCGLGTVTANGLLYSSPYSCTCEIGTMLTSFNALYDDARSQESMLDLSPEPRLDKGPGLAGRIAPGEEKTGSDWPTYRSTASRSGVNAATYDGNLKEQWQIRLPSTPTAPIIAGDRVFIAAKNNHMLYALTRATGDVIWSFTADARIDSPPTYTRGLVLFGSRGGWVYALRARDGALVWRFMDLPEQRLISAGGQLESAWPVCGSILVHEDVAYFAAGRQSFIDGGIVVYGLNPATGEVLHRRRMFGPLDERGFHILAPGKFRSRGFKSGIFSSENDLLYIRHQAFQPDLTPLEPEELKASHLIPSSGFLDAVPQHRTYWTIDTDLRYGGSGPSSGAGPQGDICVVDGNAYYEIRGYLPGRHSSMTPTRGYTLYSGERVGQRQEQARRASGIPGVGQWRERWSKQIP
ncbi:PQQ-like beta-propeller repeat protein, partial [Crocinitomicaceae bacterium]|nr:PQQ-like beta-propeller repeat protein [Crocinitomicaceae bacterium]